MIAVARNTREHLNSDKVCAAKCELKDEDMSAVETREGMDWPNGYDAQLAYQMLDIYGTPTYLLYDQSGRSVWGGHSLDGLEDAVTALLAEK